MQSSVGQGFSMDGNEQSDQDSRASTGPSDLQDNKAEFVRSIWSRLGVGHDGYLSLADLTKVCHAIGMENNAKELFSRLDLDGDGRISFGEFLHLFQKGSGDNSSASYTASAPDQAAAPPSAVTQVKRSKSNTSSGSNSSSVLMVRPSGLEEELSSGGVTPLLLPLEPTSSTASRHGSGGQTLPVWRVLQQWESHGVGGGAALLQDLGLPHSPDDQLLLQDLLAAVEEECCVAATDSGGGGGSNSSSKRSASGGSNQSSSPRRALCWLLLQETKHLRMAVESAWCERDKLRTDLSLTSHRLSSQAQELDDHTMALEATAHQHIQSVEKQHQESVRALQERLSSEREAREQAQQALADTTLRADHLQEQLSRSKAQLQEANKTCERLDAENSELTAKLEASSAALTDAQELNTRLKQQGFLAGSGSPASIRRAARGGAADEEEAEWQEALGQLSRLRQENQGLRDTNDELMARIDQLTLHQPFAASHQPFNMGEVSLDGSCMGDYSFGPAHSSINNSLSSVPTTTTSTQETNNTSMMSACHHSQQPNQYQQQQQQQHYFHTTLATSISSRMPPATITTSANNNFNNSSFSSSADYQQPSSMPASVTAAAGAIATSSSNSGGSGGWGVRLKRSAVTASASTEDTCSPRDISSAGRRSSPDLLSPRAGKIARCATSSPPPHQQQQQPNISTCNMVSTAGAAEAVSSGSDHLVPYYSCSQPASLELQGCSWGGRGGSASDRQQRRVASTNSVGTNGGLSSSSGSISPSVSAPHSARRGRGSGLEADLLGLRVEVAGLVQQRDHLASCVASLQIQLDAQLTQWGEWETSLKKMIAEQQPSGRSNAEADNPASSASTNAGDSPDNLSKESVCGSANNLLLLHAQLNASSSHSLLGSPTADTHRSAGGAAEDQQQQQSGGSGAGGGGGGLTERSDGFCLEADAISEVSSNFQDSPRKPPGDLQPLLVSLQAALQSHQQTEATQRQSLQSELQTVEKEKAELQDRFNQLEIDLQGVKGELDKCEEYWLLKLQEEQDYYEEERRVYDDNFAKLEAKICEYEADELNKAASEAGKQRLTPIDESVMFEQQVSALELEVSEVQQQLQEAEAAREEADQARVKADQARVKAEAEAATARDLLRKAERRSAQAEPAAVAQKMLAPPAAGDEQQTGSADVQHTATHNHQSTSLSAAAAERQNGTDRMPSGAGAPADPPARLYPVSAGRAEEGARVASLPPASSKDTEEAEPGLELGCSCSNADQQQVMQQLQESCKQLHAAQHTATTAREELESLGDEMQQRLQGLIDSDCHTVAEQQQQQQQHSGKLPSMLPVTAVTSLLKGCREQQRAQVCELEAALAAAHHHLQHHAAHHAQQVRRAESADKLLTDLYVENAELMRALQITEERQKRAEQQLRMRAS